MADAAWKGLPTGMPRTLAVGYVNKLLGDSFMEMASWRWLHVDFLEVWLSAALQPLVCAR